MCGLVGATRPDPSHPGVTAVGILSFLFKAAVRSANRASGDLRGKCYVIDGDTIVIQRKKIRLAGIDAPELDQPWGQKSKWAMVTLCRGRVITAELNGERSQERLVATCYLPDGRDIGAELIKQGLALDWAHFSGGKYRSLEPKGVRQKLMRSRMLRLDEVAKQA